VLVTSGVVLSYDGYGLGYRVRVGGGVRGGEEGKGGGERRGREGGEYEWKGGKGGEGKGKEGKDRGGRGRERRGGEEGKGDLKGLGAFVNIWRHFLLQ
jgi:hypothetical protein